MKTLYKLVITKDQISDRDKFEQAQADDVMRIPGVLDIKTSYLVIPDILDQFETYDEANIKSIPNIWKWAKDNPEHYKGNHVVYVRVSESDWKNRKWKSSIYGLQNAYQDRIITMGKWNERSRYQQSHKFPSPFDKLSEQALGIWHELTHGFARQFGLGNWAWSHTFFYGYDKLYTKADEARLKPRRYRKTPNPRGAWRALPWAKLKDKKPTPPKSKYKYFSANEVVGLNHELVVLLDQARGKAGIPFSINSGYRSPEHNARVGGVPGSAHTKGLAVDLRARNGQEIYKIVSSLMAVGIKRIGINWSKQFVHADIDYTKPNPTIYRY